MPEHPTFSIIVPSHGRPGALLDCLQAVRQLEYRRDDLEVVVVDDGNAEPLETRCAGVSDVAGIRWVRLAENAGPAAARNEGARSARGTYLAFTDDDCLPDRRWLAALEEAFAATPGAAVGGRVVSGSRANLYCAADQAILDVAYAHHNADPAHARFFSTANLAVPACGFRETGGFDPRFRAAEDREFCARWIAGGRRLVAAPDAVVVHAATSSLRRFWRRHYAFGKGAYDFRSRHTRPGGRRMRLEPAGYYGRLLLDPLRHAGIAAGAATCVLVALSQVASALGFLAARRAAHTSKGRTL